MSLFKLLPPPFDPVVGMSSYHSIPISCSSGPDPEANRPQESRKRLGVVLYPTKGVDEISVSRELHLIRDTEEEPLPRATRELVQDHYGRKHVHNKINAGPFGQHVLEIQGGKIDFTVKEVVQRADCQSETLGEG
jgi:hypothetical protein